MTVLLKQNHVTITAEWVIDVEYWTMSARRDADGSLLACRATEDPAADADAFMRYALNL